MSNTAPGEPVTRKFSPLGGFVRVFLVVFFIVFGGSALITFMLPESYVGVARVRASIPEQAGIFNSEAVLGAVAGELDLNQRFAQRYGETEPLSKEKTIQLLRRALQVQPVRGTEFVEVRFYSHSPDDAARVANAIAQTGTSNSVFAASLKSGSTVVVDKAVPSLKPARPNKVLNLTLGALVGILLGAFAGGVGARLAVGPERRPQS